MSGLVAWYPLAEQGGRANDLSGNGNHGTLNGGVTQGVSGVGGLTSYSFDGSDDYINLPSFYNLSSFTICAWIYPHSSSNSGSKVEDIIVRLWQNNDTALYVNDNGNAEAQMYNGSDSKYATGNTTSLNEWSFVCSTWDGSTLSLYQNGILIDKISVSTNSSASNTNNIGYDQSGKSERYFDGNIADVRIYDRALTPKEIKTLYEQGAQGSADPTGISRYKLDGDATDSWASNDGTNNGVTFVDGKFGQAGSFDPVNDSHLEVSSLSTNIDPVSISLWYKKSSFTGSDESFIYNGNSNDSNLNFHYTRSDSYKSVRFNTKKSGSWDSYDTPDLKTDGVWHHRVVTFSSGTVTTYEDGVELDQGSLGTSSLATSDTQTTGIGADSNGYNLYDGFIDDVRIYPRALTSQEISAIYNGWTDLANPPQDGVAYYPFDGNANDSWGSNDGTVNGSTVTEDAIRGRAYSFDGTDDIITAGTISAIDVASDFTISGWINTNTSSSAQQLFIQQKTSGNRFAISVNNSANNTVEAGMYDGSRFAESSGGIYSNNYVHVSYVYDSSSKSGQLYLNGVPQSGTGSPNLSGNYDGVFRIGRLDNGNKPFNGNIDDVRIYDRALSPHEVHQLYLWGTRGSDRRSELVKK